MPTKRKPKFVDPSTLNKGDKVCVHYPEKDGVTTTKTGRVGKILKQGFRRQVLTPQGARFFDWFIDVKNIRVELLEAVPMENALLSYFADEEDNG